jgi:hypothetical protein
MLCFSVRIMTTFGTEDLACIINEIQQEGGNKTTRSTKNVDTYSTGGTHGLIDYANTDETCIQVCH